MGQTKFCTLPPQKSLDQFGCRFKLSLRRLGSRCAEFIKIDSANAAMRKSEQLTFARVFGRRFVKQFELCYPTADCHILSVTLVYCGQTVAGIKMKLGMQVGLNLATL